MTTSTTSSIPVELKNPGQVLACIGFLEAAEVLLGGAESHFDWSEGQSKFTLRVEGSKNPFAVVLESLSNATISELTPIGYVEGGTADGDGNEDEDTAPYEYEVGDEFDSNLSEVQGRTTIQSFPTSEGERNSLPIQIIMNGLHLTASHWADGTSRDNFKLYSGNRSASRIATQMVQGVRAKQKKDQSTGAIKSQGLKQLWQEQQEALIATPFDVVTPMGGSFNFDARGAWTAIDAGYSPNTQKDSIAASPVVELLAAIGLENARPDQYKTRTVRYAVWRHPLPPMLARVALAGIDLKLPMRRFKFELNLSGKNKVTTFAIEETQP